MSIATKVLVNISKIYVPTGAILFKSRVRSDSGTVDTTVTSDGIERSLFEWLTYFTSQSSAIAEFDYRSYEYVMMRSQFAIGDYLILTKWAPIDATGVSGNIKGSENEIAATDLMVRIGCILEDADDSSDRLFVSDLTAGTPDPFITDFEIMNYDSSQVTWGSNRLVVQNSASTDTKGIEWLSRTQEPKRITGKFNNTTWESISYVRNSYDKRFDFKRWVLTCRWLGTEKEKWPANFYDACGNGKNSDIVRLYGDDFWIKSTENWYLITEKYEGIETDLSHALLVQFKFGLRERIS